MQRAPAGSRILVFGEALVDDFVHEQVVGGAPFNVARHLSAFLAPPLMITRVGDDQNGRIIRAEFERFAMSERGLQVDPIEETGRVLVERGPNGHRFVIQPRQAYDFIHAAEALSALHEQAPHTLYFGTLAQRGERSRAALDMLLGATDATRFLDLNLRPGHADQACVTRSLEVAHIVKVNEAELQFLFGWYEGIGRDSAALSTEEVHHACQSLVQRFGWEGLIVTLGHRGSCWFGRDGATIAHRDNPAPPFVIDAAGAGDAFSAVFLLGRERAWPLATALARANDFAGAICAIAGAMPADFSLYDRYATRWRLEDA